MPLLHIYFSGDEKRQTSALDSKRIYFSCVIALAVIVVEYFWINDSVFWFKKITIDFHHCTRLDQLNDLDATTIPKQNQLTNQFRRLIGMERFDFHIARSLRLNCGDIMLLPCRVACGAGDLHTTHTQHRAYTMHAIVASQLPSRTTTKNKRKKKTFEYKNTVHNVYDVYTVHNNIHRDVTPSIGDTRAPHTHTHIQYT